MAYLALFVLAAAEQNADLNANAYHPHLARLLQVAQAGPLPSFDQMEKLWQDLAWWANERQHELLGRFTFRRRGHLTHVGLPRAQTLLSRDERQALPNFFELAELYPGEQVPDARLTQLLLRHGSSWLQARTRRLLQTATKGPVDDQLLRTALLELVQDELLRWDGQLDATALPDSAAPRPQPMRAGLRVFVRDQGMGRLAVRLRFRAARELPDAELQLRQGPLHLTCYGLPGGGGWTSELAHPDGAVYDAAGHNWLKPLALHDTVRDYTARLRGGAVRLLLPAERHGLPKGWLEAEALEDEGPFRLLVHASR